MLYLAIHALAEYDEEQTESGKEECYAMHRLRTIIVNNVSQCAHKANSILGVIKHCFCNLDQHSNIFTSFWLDPILTMLALYGIPICWKKLGL